MNSELVVGDRKYLYAKVDEFLISAAYARVRDKTQEVIEQAFKDWLWGIKRE